MNVIINYIIIMSRTSFRMGLYSSMPSIKELLDRRSNKIRTHNHLVRQQTLSHLAKLTSSAKCLSVCLRTKWLWVRISLLSIRKRLLEDRNSFFPVVPHFTRKLEFFSDILPMSLETVSSF